MRTWEEVFDTRPLAPGSDFFALGGDSLAAAQVAAEIEEHTGVRLPLNEFSQNPTIEALASAVQRLQRLQLIGTLQVFHGEGARRPLFLFDPQEVTIGLSLAEVLRHIAPDYPTYLAKTVLTAGGETIYDMRDVIDRHVAAIRRVQPQGPYRLAGMCSGGYVALGVASELRSQGATVDLLALAHVGHPSAYSHGKLARLLDALAWSVRSGLLPARAAAELYTVARCAQALRGAARRRGASAWDELRLALALGPYGSLRVLRELRTRVRTRDLALRDWLTASYRLPRWSGRLVFIGAETPAGDPRDSPEGWDQVTDKLDVVRVPWTYRDLYPHLPEIGEILNGYLVEADAALGLPVAEATPA